MGTERRAFKLPTADENFLEYRGSVWETIIEGQERWVITEDFAVPNGYNHKSVLVALLLPPTYPDVQIDMAYFSPELARSDSKMIRNLSSRQINGKDWQQWSRHRVGEDAWRPDIDNIQTHLLYVTAFLETELQK
ncbi:MAG TPA: E2/UBC family protein [Pyrinomonadaceae bacterium]|nr:E2/UBC family protein [Pyrinomonadaceae bacterium]